jgi:hypothetical protein
MTDMKSTLAALDDIGDALMDARAKAVGGVCHCGSSGASHDGACSWHCTDAACPKFHPNR